MLDQFINNLFGGQAKDVFLTNVFYAYLGVTLALLISTTYRDVDSNRTPKPFSWKFLLLDNWKRIAIGFITIYLSLRFTPELFNIQISNFWAVIIGCSHDALIYVIRNRIKDFKTKLNVADNPTP